MDINQTDHSRALAALTSTLTLGFRFLAWINGMGIVAVLSLGVGIVQLELAPQWLRLPLAAFLGGLTLSALGLLWAYPVQASLLNQLVLGRARRTHWIPLFCTMVAYSLALLAFVFGCWATLGLASLAYQNSADGPGADDQGVELIEQSGEPLAFIYDAAENTLRPFVTLLP
ncbi:hypothetical protein H0A66_02750 [Alcaligenaceae bacterium]|nr:hypothetical protein [Alcaligenaceae bacterium]